MARYRNVRDVGDVLGVSPGEVIDIVLGAAQERQLIRGGHIERLPVPKPKKQKAK